MGIFASKWQQSAFTLCMHMHEYVHAHKVHVCVLSSTVAEKGVHTVTLHRAPPAACQDWPLLPWDLWFSCPNCSQASKIKSPWDTFAEANPAPTMRHKLHIDTFMADSFFSFSIFSFFYIYYFTSPLTFGEFSQFLPPCFLPLHFLKSFFFFSSLSVVLFFCFLLLISMVTVHFPGIMEARGLGGVKADAWVSHK